MAAIATSSRATVVPGKRPERRVEVTELTPLIGAEVAGIDLSEPVTPARLEDVRSLLLGIKYSSSGISSLARPTT